MPVSSELHDRKPPYHCSRPLGPLAGPIVHLNGYGEPGAIDFTFFFLPLSMMHAAVCSVSSTARCGLCGEQLQYYL